MSVQRLDVMTTIFFEHSFDIVSISVPYPFLFAGESDIGIKEGWLSVMPTGPNLYKLSIYYFFLTKLTSGMGTGRGFAFSRFTLPTRSLFISSKCGPNTSLNRARWRSVRAETRQKRWMEAAEQRREEVAGPTPSKARRAKRTC